MLKKKFFYRKCLSSIVAATVMVSAVLHYIPVSYAFASSAGQAVRVTTQSVMGHTYYAFGEDVDYSIGEDWLCDGNLSDGTSVYSPVDSNESNTIVLSDSVKNFKLSFKYYADFNLMPESDPYAMRISMRRTGQDAYTFGLHTSGQNAVGFEGFSETSESGTSAINDGWHTVKIVVVDNRMKIMVDGLVYKDVALKDDAQAGALTLDARYVKIAALSADNATEVDFQDDVILDWDFSTEGLSLPALPGQRFHSNYQCLVDYNSEDFQKHVIGKTWFKDGFCGRDTTVNIPDNNTIELSFDILKGTVYNRGFALALPSGRTLLIGNSCLRLYKSGAGFGSVEDFTANFEEKNINNLREFATSLFEQGQSFTSKHVDGGFHTLRVVSKDGWEQVFVDNILIFTNEIDEAHATHELAYTTFRAGCNILIKDLRIIDNTEKAERKALATKVGFNDGREGLMPFGFNNGEKYSDIDFLPGFKDGVYAAQATAVRGNFIRTRGFFAGDNPFTTQENEDWCYSTDFYAEPAIFEGDVSAFGLQLRKSNANDQTGFNFTLYKDRFTVSGKGLDETVNTENLTGRWVNLRIFFIGTHVIVALDGTIHTFDVEAYNKEVGLAWPRDVYSKDLVVKGDHMANNFWMTNTAYWDVTALTDVVTTIDSIYTDGVLNETALNTAREKFDALPEEEKATIAEMFCSNSADGQHSYTHYVSDDNATCTEDGTKTATCDNGCGRLDTVADIGSKKTHSYTHYVSNNDATCTKDGTKRASCDYGCGETDTVVDTGSKKGHSYTNYVSNNNATCEEDGTKTATCDNGCGGTDTIADTGSKKGHSYSNYVSNNDATCEEDGTETAICDNCESMDTRTAVDSKLGHDWELVSTDPATCTAGGKKHYACKNDRQHTKEEELAVLGHTYGEWSVTKAATAAESGEKTHTCTVCGNKETVEIPAIRAEIVGVPDGVWETQKSENLSVKVNGDFGDVLEIKVDGIVLGKDRYAVEADGSVAFKAAYLNVLAAGSHTIVIAFTDGETSAEIVVKATVSDESNVTPPTGENSNHFPWVIVTCISLITLFAFGRLLRKKLQSSSSTF